MKDYSATSAPTVTNGSVDHHGWRFMNGRTRKLNRTDVRNAVAHSHRKATCNDIAWDNMENNMWHSFTDNTVQTFLWQMSRDMTKPTKWVCAQRRLRSAWAYAQSDQSLGCPHEETLGPQLPTERTARTPIRLGGCPGWSESSLCTCHFFWFCYEVAHILVIFQLKCFV